LQEYNKPTQKGIHAIDIFILPGKDIDALLEKGVKSRDLIAREKIA
jgi:hypothetical protein